MANQLNVHQYPVGPMENFIYLLECPDTHQIAVVDPAWDFSLIQSEINRLNGQLSMVLITHCHFDHINALEQVLEHYDIPVYVSIQSQTSLINELPQTIRVGDGDRIQLGNESMSVITTPGHSICGQCFYLDQSFVITGDTLFINGCGRADLSDSDPDALYDSLQRIQALPDSVTIYCGHHYGEKEVDSLGNQKQSNPYLTCPDRATFIRKRMGRS
tara:strand:+ start:445 stop:1092 length:648 start_codon:yes stop_codon:yes gene_type:complete